MPMSTNFDLAILQKIYWKVGLSKTHSSQINVVTKVGPSPTQNCK